MKIKKIIASALLLCMTASLSACGEKENTTSNTTSNNISQSSTSSTNIITPEYHNNIYSDIKYESSNKNNDYEYIEYVDHVQITKYLGSQTDVTIPSKINDKPVTFIGGNIISVFGKNLNTVIIPDTVTSIGNYAFGSCPNLSNITIPDSVINIYCTKNSTPFENTKWYDNQPNGIVYAGKVALDYKTDNKGTTESTNITIKDDTLSIAPFAFDYCNISSIVIPKGVKKIGQYAFWNCENLSNISISDSVISIGNGAFEGTKWFENQNDGIVYAGKVVYTYKGDIPENKKIVLKNDTISIADDAFNNRSKLAEIVIPDNVTHIGDYAFYYTQINNVSIGSNVTNIGKYAFYNCDFTNVTIPDKVITIGEYAFGKCNNLIDITIPDNTIIIGNGAFEGCSELRTTNIGNSVISIGDEAFQNCVNLEEVKSGNNIKYIGSQAFLNCSKIENIVLPDSITYIGKDAFKYLYSGYKVGTIPTQGKASSLIQ